MQGEDSGTSILMRFCKGAILEKIVYFKHLFFMCILSSISEEMQ